MKINPWLLLGIAIVFEIIGTSLLKLSDGFTRVFIGIIAVAMYGVSTWMLSITLTQIPVAISYAIWSGVGILAITLIGFVAFKQNLGGMQILCIALIAIGAIGLNLTTQTETPDIAASQTGSS
ncbi:DMT family transporter [Alterisphingorhabdus coralli]|uniref:Multidrug efflux SMR transporter n=1 Tax=Alterisphingorhabdus coralli TaxID=3071408 RepID=A0AA97F7X5_9SPHN|nr:multidrug efflux SMR transporter [Parasphingorhabdus sp. SCSIO 66989]WOE75821.1 multidrug efflux SMR transporter [Parasphingorhabdus sp. SCSIO 66989]